MVVRREKRTRKYRGSRRMGWGLQGQHRDRGASGSRSIGMHKEKWSWTVKYGTDWYGKHGFRNPTTKEVSALSLRRLYDMILSGSLEPEEENGVKYYDLTKLGVEKLIGGGSVPFGVSVKVKSATEKAIKSLEEKGGKVIIAE